MSGYENERHNGRHRYEDSDRMARGSLSPAHKRRAVAADYFEDDNTQNREDTHSHRHHRDRDRDRRSNHRERDAQGEDGRREHKRRKHHHRSHNSSSRRHGQNATTTTPPPPPAELPFKARLLSYKHDLDAFEPLFANYLDIQKGKYYYNLDAYEQRGRWKSFVHKWNSGQLAEGWYDPEMFERIAKEASERVEAEPWVEPVGTRARSNEDDAPESPPSSPRDPERNENEEYDDDEDDDDYGPPPPPGTTRAATSSSSRKGPGIPSLADLALQREAAAEAHAARAADLRLARKADRVQQKERLDELVPRAEPGTRERKLEKKAAVNEKMRSFRDKGDAAAVEEVDDGDLMGGGDGVDDYKRAVASQQRKKTERELRREEEARARWQEREEKLKEWKAREEEKMKGLKELAKARFG